MRLVSSLLGISATFGLLAACVADATTTPAGATDGGADSSSPADAAGPDSSSVPDSSTIPDASVPDSADAAPPWSPASLNGLVVWLDGSKDVSVANGTVQNWKDQSGTGNNAFNLLPANQPTTVASVVNGKPVIRFDGTGKQWLNIFDATSLQFGTADYTVAEVVAYTNTPSANNTTGYGALWVKALPNSPYNGVALFGNDPIAPNGSVRSQVNSGVAAFSKSLTVNDGKFHVVATRRTGASLESRADGVAGTANANTGIDVSAAKSDVYIGGRGGNANQQALKGDIAEIIVVKGTVSDQDLGTLEGYLKSKYAL